MQEKNVQEIKSQLHPRNRHRNQYDFDALVKSCPELAPFVILNDNDIQSINFFDQHAVKALNKALLLHHYGIKYWDIPQGYLTPPVPGRADYIHYLADLLAASNDNKIPKGQNVKCFDISTGANCIYPIIGQHEYGWSFVATEVDPAGLESARKIVDENTNLKKSVEIREQANKNLFFQGVMGEKETFDLSICNPPFHSSKKDADTANRRKLRRISTKEASRRKLNFGGKANELWTAGGEELFIRNMIHESRIFANNCFWFSSLVSKEDNLQSVYQAFKKAKVVEYKTIKMGQGNKKSRLVAWTFLSEKQQKIWADAKWP